MSEDILNSDEPLVRKLSDDEKLEDLKGICKAAGIKFHPKIKYPALQAKYKAYKEEQAKLAKENAKGLVNNQDAFTKAAMAQSELEPSARKSLRMQRMEQLKLVRVRVNPLNVHMNGLKGQVFTVANALVGTVSKYVPFNSPYGWHIPQILLDEIQTKEYQTFRSIKQPNGRESVKNELAKAYSVEVLPPLSEHELKSIQDNIRLTEGGDY